MFTHNIFFSCLWQQDGQLTELPDGLWKNSVLLSQTILTNNDIEYVVCVDVAAAVMGLRGIAHFRRAILLG